MNLLPPQSDDLPPLPLVATRVMAMVQDPSTTAKQLARIVSTDQGLTAKLIRLANSAEYAFGRRCASAQEAIHLLGFLQLRQIAITSSLMSAFSGPVRSDDPFDTELFWAHSLTVGVAAESVARETRLATPADAFTAGVLHDIGRLIIRRAMPNESREAGRLAVAEGLPLRDAELRVTGLSHEAVGRAAAIRWQFPEHLADAIGRHHEPGLSPAACWLAGIVSQCDRMVLSEGISCGFFEEEPLAESDPLSCEVAQLAGGIAVVLSKAAWYMDNTVGFPKLRRPAA